MADGLRWSGTIHLRSTHIVNDSDAARMPWFYFGQDKHTHSRLTLQRRQPRNNIKRGCGPKCAFYASSVVKNVVRHVSCFGFCALLALDCACVGVTRPLFSCREINFDEYSVLIRLYLIFLPFVLPFLDVQHASPGASIQQNTHYFIFALILSIFVFIWNYMDLRRMKRDCGREKGRVGRKRNTDWNTPWLFRFGNETNSSIETDKDSIYVNYRRPL